jgi:hypothetical protein
MMITYHDNSGKIVTVHCDRVHFYPDGSAQILTMFNAGGFWRHELRVLEERTTVGNIISVRDDP